MKIEIPSTSQIPEDEEKDERNKNEKKIKETIDRKAEVLTEKEIKGLEDISHRFRIDKLSAKYPKVPKDVIENLDDLILKVKKTGIVEKIESSEEGELNSEERSLLKEWKKMFAKLEFFSPSNKEK